MNIAVFDLAVNRKATLEKIIEVSQKAIKKDGADSLVLGCMSMGFLNVADEISNVLNIPVINLSKIALKIAESLIGSGLMYSKKAFALPPKLSSGKAKSIDQLYIRKQLKNIYFMLSKICNGQIFYYTFKTMPGSISSVYQEYFHPDAEFSHYYAEAAKAKLVKVGFKSSNRSGN